MPGVRAHPSHRKSPAPARLEVVPARAAAPVRGVPASAAPAWRAPHRIWRPEQAMSEADLNTLEHDVEQARARFAADLARVRSPTTFANFKDDLLAQARDTKDGLLHDLKDRAIANPIATLAIGAGVAWRLVRHPPIA